MKMYQTNNFNFISSSPLDQFEIRNLLNVQASILNDTNISLTNIGLYLSIAAAIVFFFNILSSNYNKILSNK